MIKAETAKFDLLQSLSKVVQARREHLDLSQEEVAGRAGLHRTYISDIERGARNLSLRSLARLSCALEMPVSELLRLAEMSQPIELSMTKN